MSLARIAIRIATVEALRGRTLVGGNVLDSQIGSLDVGADGSIRTDQEKPFISVYTNSSKAEGTLDLRNLRQTGALDLVIESGITAAMVERDEDTGATTVIGLGTPGTDPSFEFYLDCVDRQIVNALTDPEESSWAEIWRRLSNGAIKIERQRASNAEGVRLAGRQIRLSLDVLPDPVFAAPVAAGSVWRLFRDRLALDRPDLIGTIDGLFGEAGSELDHEQLRRRFGLTLEEARALFDIPPPAAEATEPVFADAGTFGAEKV